jgi:hypothetical protein
MSEYKGQSSECFRPALFLDDVLGKNLGKRADNLNENLCYSMCHDALAAVVEAANREDSLTDPLQHLLALVPVDVDSALSLGFDLADFYASFTDEIANCHVLPTIVTVLQQSDDVLLLTECADFVVLCSCGSQRCFSLLVEYELNYSLCSFVARIFGLGYPSPVVRLLNALVNIWTRLPSRTTVVPDRLQDLLSLSSSITDVYFAPFTRLLCAILDCEEPSLALLQHIGSAADDLFRYISHEETSASGELGRLVDVVLRIARSCSSKGRLFRLSDVTIFWVICGAVSLFSAETIAHILIFVGDYIESCGRVMIDEIIRAMDLFELLKFLSSDDECLVVAAIDLFSVLAEREYIPMEFAVAELIPEKIPYLEWIRSGSFPLKRGSIRLIAALVSKLRFWNVLPESAFALFMGEVITFIPSEDVRESVWFLESLLSAVRIRDFEFRHLVIEVCEDLDLRSIVGEIEPETQEIEVLLAALEEAWIVNSNS